MRQGRRSTATAIAIGGVAARADAARGVWMHRHGRAVRFAAPICYTFAMPLLTSNEQLAGGKGTRVRVTQQMPMTDRVWTETIEGVIMRFRQAKTGSWYAHAKDDQLWLDRLELRMDDGEINVLNLDQYTVIEPVHTSDASGSSAASSDGPNAESPAA